MKTKNTPDPCSSDSARNLNTGAGWNREEFESDSGNICTNTFRFREVWTLAGLLKKIQEQSDQSTNTFTELAMTRFV